VTCRCGFEELHHCHPQFLFEIFRICLIKHYTLQILGEEAAHLHHFLTVGVYEYMKGIFKIHTPAALFYWKEFPVRWDLRPELKKTKTYLSCLESKTDGLVV